MAIRAEVTIEKFGRNGRKEVRKFPSRSFTLQLMSLLYVQMSTLAVDEGWRPASLSYLESSPFDLARTAYNMVVASPGGLGHLYSTLDYSEGHEIGIGIGTGTKAVASYDYGLDKKIASKEGRTTRVLYPPRWDWPNSRMWGLTWDGSYFWAVYQNGSQSESRAYQINEWTGAEVSNCVLPGTSYSYNRGLTWDGTYLWVTGYDSGQTPVYRVYQINTSGVVQNHWGAPNGNRAEGLVYDGTYIWVCEGAGNYQIHQCATSDGAIQQSLNNPWSTSTPLRGLAFDGTYLWVLGESTRNFGRYQVAKMTTAGVVQKYFYIPCGTTGTSYNTPFGLTWKDDFLFMAGYYYYTALRWNAIMQIAPNSVRFDYGGCEVVDDESYVNPNGSFTIRRYFTNKSGSSITVNEVGIFAAPRAGMIARDIVSPGVAVADGETLKVEYTIQVTV